MSFSRYKSILLLTALIQCVHIINADILVPPYFNLVANKKVEATATCGEGINDPEIYCKLTGSTASDRETSSYANLIQVTVLKLNKNFIYFSFK